MTVEVPKDGVGGSCLNAVMSTAERPACTCRLRCERGGSAAPPSDLASAVSSTPLAVAGALYAERRRRDRIFGKDLFGEANWDILLDLFTAGEQGQAIPMTSACIAACVPPTTALRRIVELEHKGLVERHTLERDRRIALVRLTAEARRLMLDYLQTIASSR